MPSMSISPHGVKHYIEYQYFSKSYVKVRNSSVVTLILTSPFFCTMSHNLLLSLLIFQRLLFAFSSIRFKLRSTMHPRQTVQSRPRLMCATSSSMWFPSADTEVASPWRSLSRLWPLEAMMLPRTTGE